MESRYRIRRDRYHGHGPPSFSSTLLDAIYRSFDDSAHDSSRGSLQQGEAVRFREMAVKSNSSCIERSERRGRGVGGADGRRSRDQIVDCWMEKTATGHDDFGDRRKSIRSGMSKGVYGNNSTEVSDRQRSRGYVKMTSSSDSSSFGGFSSSDTDSFYGAKKKSKSLKPIRTSFSDRSETFRPPESLSDEILYRKNRRSDDKPAKGEGSAAGRTAKSRAMKFYGDLKRMKQPISPGGKLATFLNSLFNASGNAKKQRISTSTATGNRCDDRRATGNRCDDRRWERPESKSNYTTTSTHTCSTASSYSRSCLSKTPSSAGAKRSVRFSPVSTVIDEDLGHKSFQFDDTLTTTTNRSTSSNSGTLDQDLKLPAMEKNRSVEEAAMELLKNYNKKWELSAAKAAEMVEEDDHGEDEDAESCCSSDLFELENLLQIGVDRYCAELPVYETTRVDTNRAIASGLIV